MSRKGVRRGQKYTTRVNRDGSQQYARRGCMVMALLALFIVAGPVVGVCAFWVGLVAR